MLRVRAHIWMAGAAMLALGACSTTPEPVIEAPPPVAVQPPPAPEPRIVYNEIGTASWYGRSHHGKKTASGEPYDMNAMTAAHKTLPFNTRARVTNLDSGRSVDVLITDRGPYARGRIIDLSSRAAKALDMHEDGIAPVRVEVLEGNMAEAPAPKPAAVTLTKPQAAAPVAKPAPSKTVAAKKPATTKTAAKAKPAAAKPTTSVAAKPPAPENPSTSDASTQSAAQ